MPYPSLSPASAPYDFSAATTAALVALLTSKADGAQFSLSSSTPTRLRFTGYATWQYATPGQLPPQGINPSLAASLRPASASTAVLYSWVAVYRGRRQGGSLVADQAYSAVANGVLAQQAIEWMNWLDLRYQVRPTPNPEPDVAGLALDPRGNIVGGLLGYKKPWIG